MGTPSGSPTWVIRIQAVGPCFTAFPGATAGSCTRSGSVRIETSADIEYWHARQEISCCISISAPK